MRIVSLAHYPVSQARHGGQIRVAAILQVLRRAGHEVHFFPLHLGAFHPEATPDEQRTALPDTVRARLQDEGLREDLHLARVLGPDHPQVAWLRQQLLDLKPDILQFEHPWLFALVEPWLELPGLAQTRIVYSAQNVEAALMDPAWRDEAFQLENRLVRRADLVVAVSAPDAAIFDGWRGRGARPAVVAPNGCWMPETADLPDVPPIEGDYAVVVGSAHPPNACGYWECIGEVPGFLPPGSRLVVIGGMNDQLRANPRYRHFRSLNEELVVNAGVVPPERLAAYLHHAKVICLPITEGGGTNLKTAEALAWLKPVVAMRMAMRGYDEALDMPGVHVADTPAEFRRLMRAALTGSAATGRTARDVIHYSWPARLEPMVQALEAAQLGVEGTIGMAGARAKVTAQDWDALGQDAPLTPAVIDQLYQAHLGRAADDDGREFALGAGMTVGQLERSILQSQDYKDSGRPISGHAGTQFDSSFLYFRPARVVFCPIAKVANTSVKDWFLRMDSDRAARPELSHQRLDTGANRMQGRHWSLVLRDKVRRDPDWARIALIRNPLDRLVSAYCDKFGRNRRPPGMLHHTGPVYLHFSGGKQPDPALVERGLTFRQFCLYLKETRKDLLDPHWAPQGRYLENASWTHLYPLERVDRFEAFVTGRLADGDARGGLGLANVAPRKERVMFSGDLSDSYPQEWEGGKNPPAACFLAPDLCDFIEDYYAMDFILHEKSLRDTGHRNLPGLVQRVRQLAAPRSG